MTIKQDTVDTALARLNGILPLTARQAGLDSKLQQLHKAMLHAYVDIGRSLNRNEMAQQVNDLDKAIHSLQENDLVVFNDDSEPIGAYPFTMESRDHLVTVNGHNVHCMCALDALAVSPMFNLPIRITSRCHISAEPITIQQHGMKISAGDNAQDIFFGIDWSASSNDNCCANSLCTEMIFLKGRAVADNWLAESTGQQQIFPLDEAVELAARFFVPLL